MIRARLVAIAIGSLLAVLAAYGVTAIFEPVGLGIGV